MRWAPGWYVACLSSELRTRPVAKVVAGVPLVVFRDAGGVAHALEDRCPHRGMPLSAGRIVAGEIQCAYHGWRFGSSGACRAIPGLVGEASRLERAATPRSMSESDGFAWVYIGDDAGTRSEPLALPVMQGAQGRVDLQAVVEASLEDALENILDVPHTGFLHRGLFRSGAGRNEIDVEVGRDATSCRAEFHGEPRPEGLLGRLLAPMGGVVRHVDRFVMPCVAQVEYALGDDVELVVTHLLTPVDERRTVMRHAVMFRTRLPVALVRPAIHVLGGWLLRQDVRALARVARNDARFGGAQRHASTELDVIGPHLRALIRAAADGTPPPPPATWRVRMRA
jgi:phenylpropionate dioxygenase-like ring-hydroxylating dioxygenase large terminal subunit